MDDYTSIAEGSSITVDTLKLFLRIDDDEVGAVMDPLLEIVLAAAKECADNYCQDDFDPVPPGIEWWILQTCSLWWERRSAMLTGTNAVDLGSSSWGFNYDDFYLGLKTYRKEVGFW